MNTPYLGLIEGFFGRAWSFLVRYDYADFLQKNGYHFYIYAPKNDPFLRKRWQEDWPAAAFAQLQTLVTHYQSLGLDFGIGLSPFEIYTNYDRSARNHLQKKIAIFNRLGINMLCVLFDDMRGDLPDLAQTQTAIIHDILEQTGADRVIMCPTYYSFDPVLETVFGSRPTNYFQDIAQGIPAAVDMLWTGPQVCSQEYPASHLQEVTQLLGRKPFLWDNYPVNDGQITSKFLHLKAFEHRPGSLPDMTAGHAANPMNQPWLSRIPLLSLPRSYHRYAEGRYYNPQQATQEAITQLCEKKLAQHIIDDMELLHTQGLDRIDPVEKKALVQKYSSFDSPYAQEIVAWLNEEYTFDPSCLTS
ncbi:MAG: hyaluronidase [Candidatus Electrothrix sp. AW1]|nr:hyaluronidase [Candidatus Electrothrix sp. AX1]MCI5183544.1 hyaluronidase [Candidatus Electrothrix gigas]